MPNAGAGEASPGEGSSKGEADLTEPTGDVGLDGVGKADFAEPSGDAGLEGEAERDNARADRAPGPGRTRRFERLALVERVCPTASRCRADGLGKEGASGLDSWSPSVDRASSNGDATSVSPPNTGRLGLTLLLLGEWAREAGLKSPADEARPEAVERNASISWLTHLRRSSQRVLLSTG